MAKTKVHETLAYRNALRTVQRLTARRVIEGNTRPLRLEGSALVSDGRTRRGVLAALVRAGVIEPAGSCWLGNPRAHESACGERPDLAALVREGNQDGRRAWLPPTLDSLPVEAVCWIAAHREDYWLHVYRYEKCLGVHPAGWPLDEWPGGNDPYNRCARVSDEAARAHITACAVEAYAAHLFQCNLGWAIENVTAVPEADAKRWTCSDEPRLSFGGHCGPAAQLGTDPAKWAAQAAQIVQAHRKAAEDAQRALASIERTVAAVEQTGGWEALAAHLRQASREAAEEHVAKQEQEQQDAA